MDQHESGRSSAADREKLLPHNRDSTESVDPEQYYHQSQQKKSSWLARSWRQLLIIGLATYSLIITSLLLKEESSLLETTLAWSPARHLLTYEVKPLWDKTIDDKYAQPPSDETDAAWADLLTGMNFRLSQEEFDRSVETQNASVQITDGQYVGILDVYHQLHCLDVLRRGTHPDYYLPRATPGDIEINYQSAHYMHCIERLRRIVMCHADVGLYTAEWIADSHEPENKVLKTNADTVCVNWDAIDQWARKRALKPFGYHVLPGPFEKSHHTDLGRDTSENEDA